MSIPRLGVALVGAALALLAYRRSGEKELTSVMEGADEDE